MGTSVSEEFAVAVFTVKKMEAPGFAEALVPIYETSRDHIPQTVVGNFWKPVCRLIL
jgi:hypothetical protein